MREEDLTEDRLLGGRLRLLQPRRGHRAGTDAVLLAGCSPIAPGDRIVDLGASTGAVGLMAARRVPGCHVVLVEREQDLAALARRNVALNGACDYVDVVEADLFRSLREIAPGSVDLVLTNPPFFEAGGRASPDPGRRAAHVLAGGTLEGWLAAAARLLRPRGRLAMIHRADALPFCLDALGRSFGSIEIQPIQPRGDEPASRILLFAVKGGRAPFRLRAALVLHGPDGEFTAEATALHGGANEQGASRRPSETAP